MLAAKILAVVMATLMVVDTVYYVYFSSLPSFGYQKYYAEDNYPKGWTVNLEGLNDGDFLSKTADYIKRQPV